MKRARVSRFAGWRIALAVLVGTLLAATAGAQPAEPDLADQQFEAAMAEEPAPPAEAAPEEPEDEGMNLLHMASPQVGGIFLYPIYGFSFLVVLFGIERAIALRRRRVIPPKLVRGIDALLEDQAGFDPRKAWRLCQKYPSAAASVLTAALLKTGRPMAELERTVTAASEREANRLYGNIRPLNLSATVAPLLGLVGTVQGMILAFYETAHLPDGANKAQALASGVYIALITTFAGLCVAIPAVCLAHYYEGKIQRLFGRLDDVVGRLLPALERYEGKARVNRTPAVPHVAETPVTEGEAPHRTAAASE
ncbi:MAG: MotA/TolQ/ExbB proton channel family protein [Planctomycetota bacterium]|nr:MAG: MotA/TolQ/ExbB proton channel family protein [Planctomycetota bacterium]